MDVFIQAFSQVPWQHPILEMAEFSQTGRSIVVAVSDLHGTESALFRYSIDEISRPLFQRSQSILLGRIFRIKFITEHEIEVQGSLPSATSQSEAPLQNLRIILN
jgi:hypothetical protein